MQTTLALLAARLCLLALIPAAPATGPSAISDREGLPIITWQDAERFMDRQVIVQGTIASTRTVGSVCFLNFDDSPRHLFAAVIRRDDLPRFPTHPEKAYAGRHVRILGRISEFRGKLQILVHGPDQIEVLDTLPEIPAAPASAPAVRPTGRLRVATFNIMNLFDGHDDPYRDDEGTPPKPRDQIERVAAVIREIDADVLALQEVENRDYLERFVRAMLPDLGYEHVVLFEGNDMRGIDVALLSRVPVGPVTSHRHMALRDEDGRPVRFHRDLLQVVLAPPEGPQVAVFVVHLKSKGTGPSSDAIRLAEARAIRQVLDGLLARDPQACFVLCGDMNDTWDSPALKTLRGEGPGALRCFFEEVPEDRRITFTEEPYRSMIDFILCSPAMAGRHVPGSYRIPQLSLATAGSDHNPVITEFHLD